MGKKRLKNYNNETNKKIESESKKERTKEIFKNYMSYY